MYDFSSLFEFDVELDTGNVSMLFCTLALEDSNKLDLAIDTAKMSGNNIVFHFHLYPIYWLHKYEV